MKFRRLASPELFHKLQLLYLFHIVLDHFVPFLIILIFYLLQELKALNH